MKKRTSVIVLLLVLLIAACTPLCRAQTADSVHALTADTATKKSASIPRTPKPVVSRFVDKDSLAFALKPHPFQPNPKKAGLYAAILPGLGQVYNRQYWKIPIVYAVMGTTGYFVANNLTNYRKYRKAYVGRLTDPNYRDEFSELNVGDQIAYVKQIQDDYSKNLNISVLLTGVGYFLQVLDAITGAHLKNFDMSRDISMHVQPVAMPNGIGMGLVMNF